MWRRCLLIQTLWSSHGRWLTISSAAPGELPLCRSQLNSNQTHLKQLIQVFSVDHYRQAFELKSAGRPLSRSLILQRRKPYDTWQREYDSDAIVTIQLFYIWKELERRHFNGPDFKYKIYWRQASGRSPHWNESSASNPPFIVNVNGTFIPFEIKVQAVNELGTGPEPDAEIGYSGEDCAFSKLSYFSFTLCFALS